MSGQQLLPEEPTSPVIPSSRTNFASLKARVENVERKMGELRETWMKDIQEHLGKDANMEPMKLEGTLNIQEFDSIELFHDAQMMNKIRRQLSEEVKMLKADIMVELKDELKVELKHEILEELKVEMQEALSKEFGAEKELLRKMKMCFVSASMQAKSTQVNDGDLPETNTESESQEIFSQSQESVSLLAKYRYH